MEQQRGNNPRSKFVSDLDEDDSGGTGITQMHNKPADSARCKSEQADPPTDGMLLDKRGCQPIGGGE